MVSFVKCARVAPQIELLKLWLSPEKVSALEREASCSMTVLRISLRKENYKNLERIHPCLFRSSRLNVVKLSPVVLANNALAPTSLVAASARCTELLKPVMRSCMEIFKPSRAIKPWFATALTIGQGERRSVAAGSWKVLSSVEHVAEQKAPATRTMEAENFILASKKECTGLK